MRSVSMLVGGAHAGVAGITLVPLMRRRSGQGSAVHCSAPADPNPTSEGSEQQRF